MPLYNVKLTISRTVAFTNYSWVYASPQANGNVFIGSVTTQPFIQGQLQNLGYIIFKATDRNDRNVTEALSEFRGQMLFTLVSGADPTKWAQASFKVLDVVSYLDALAAFVESGGTQFSIRGLRTLAFNPASDSDLYVMVDRTQDVTTTFGRTLAANLTPTQANGFIAIAERQGAAGGTFTFDTWGRFVSAQNAIDFLAATGVTGDPTATRVLDCRYDERVAVGLVVTTEGESWRLTKVVEIEPRRVLRLSLEKILQ